MAIYNGNAVGYGSAGQWYVSVEVSDNGAGPGPQCTVYYTYKVYFSASISDSSNTINWTDPWGSGSANNRSFQSAGMHVVSGTHSQLANISYGANNLLHFRMYATGMAGSSGASVVEFDYPLPARTAGVPGPTNTFVSSVTATSALLHANWNDTGGGTIDVVEYALRDGIHGGNVGTDTQAGWGGVTYSGLTRGRPYWAYSRAHSVQAGWGPYSAATGFTTLTITPDAPAMSAASWISQTAYHASWTAPYDGGAGLSGYHLQVDDDPGFSSPHLDTTLSPATLGRDVTGLTLNTQYYARVRTWNGNGYSGWSATQPVLTSPGVPNVPPAPTFTGVSGVSGTMNWVLPSANGSPVDQFYIQMDDDPAFGSPVVNGTAPLATRQWQANGLIPNRTYYARVQAGSTVGWSGYSAVSSFRTSAGFYISVGGVPKEAVLYVSVGGVPKLADLYLTAGGVPRLI